MSIAMASLRPKVLNFDAVSGSVLEGVGKLLSTDNPASKPLTNRQYQFMFQDVYALCSAIPEPFAEKLHQALTTYVQAHVEQREKALESQQSGVLALYTRGFEAFSLGAKYTHEAFKHLNSEIDRMPHDTPLNHRPPLLKVSDLCMSVWRERLFTPLKDRIIHDVLREIERDRLGESGNLVLVKSVLQSISKMCSYEEDPLRLYNPLFETPFIDATVEFYAREAGKRLAETDMSSYMIGALDRLANEEQRAAKMLSSATQAKVMHAVEQEIIAAHKTLLAAECEGYLEKEQLGDLGNVFRLLRRIDRGVDPILATFESTIATKGVKRITDLIASGTFTPQAYFESISQLHVYYTRIVADVFANDVRFVAALDKAFRSIVNNSINAKSPVQSAEVIAKHTDAVLRKATTGDQDTEETLGAIITIFKYVGDKDIFQKFYSKMLAKRLIHGSSLSEEAEGSMIGRLKALCGYEYTSKLQKMFTDITVSAELAARFHETEVAKDIKYNFKILVLQAGAWPLGAASGSEFHIPQELERSITSFEAFYHARHNGRKLSWLHHLATADIKARFGKRVFEFGVTTYQMAVMLMFNGADSHTVAEIKAGTSLNAKELERTIRSLITCKVLLVDAEEEKESELGDACVVNVNTGYRNKKTKVKLSVAIQKEAQAQDTQQAHKAVDDDRKIFLQAVTVRIMKTRKTLKYNTLIEEVIEQSSARFKPLVPQIKKCIEELIERGYMERKEGDRNTLHYVA